MSTSTPHELNLWERQVRECVHDLALAVAREAQAQELLGYAKALATASRDLRDNGDPRLQDLCDKVELIAWSMPLMHVVVPGGRPVHLKDQMRAVVADKCQQLAMQFPEVLTELPELMPVIPVSDLPQFDA